MGRVTLASLGREAQGYMAEISAALESVGRIAVRLGRVIATAETMNADGLDTWCEKYLPDLATGHRDEYLRGGRVVRALEGIGVEVSDVAISTATTLHKCLTHRVSKDQAEDLRLWFKSKRRPMPEDDGIAVLLLVWTEAKGRKAYPGKVQAEEAMSAFGVFGSRGPKKDSDGAGSVASSNKSRGGKATAPAKSETTEDLSDADLSALTREVSATFGRISDPGNRISFGKAILPILALCEKYPAASVIALVRQEIATAESAKKATAEEAEKATEATAPKKTRRPRRKATATA